MLERLRVARPRQEVLKAPGGRLSVSAWRPIRPPRSSVGYVQGYDAQATVKADVGSTYSMQRTLPTGSVTNDLQVVEHERLRASAIRTTSGPTPFVYRFRFSPQDGATIVDLEASVRLGGAANLFASLARRAARHGVDANLTTLKTTLEATR